MTIASIRTLLSLDRFATIMGITPAHFAGGTAGSIFPVMTNCSAIWFQHPWQHGGQVAREDIARAISDAELEIAHYLGYWPAPTWIQNEVHPYPKPAEKGAIAFGVDINYKAKGIDLNYGKFIEQGARAVSLIGTPRLIFSDNDGDGYSETVTAVEPTTLTNACEIKAFYVGHAGDTEWEIRPARSVTIAGGNVTMVFWAWQLIDPDLWETFPTDTGSYPVSLDLTDGTVYVGNVELYREFNDPTAIGFTAFWENDSLGSSWCSACGGSGCSSCMLSSQTGCIHVRDVHNGIVVPTPATYNVTTGAWEYTASIKCVEPDIVSYNYYSGDYSQLRLQGRSCDPLSNYMATTIAYMAVARLDRNLCDCGPVQALSDELRKDMIIRTKEFSPSFNMDVQLSPFGTHYGEVMAYRRLKHNVQHKARATVI